MRNVRPVPPHRPWRRDLRRSAWTPLIILNLYLGCGSFCEILEGAPGLSLHPALAAPQAARTAPCGRSRHPSPTGTGTTTSSRLQATTSSRSASRSASGVRVGSGIAPENLDPFVALWSMCNALRRDRSRIDASSSASTSLPAEARRATCPPKRAARRWKVGPAPRTVSAIGYSSSSETPRFARRTRAWTRISTSRGSRSLRQMARRPAHLGPSYARGPHPTRRPPVAGKNLPHVECPERVRSHQAGLPECSQHWRLKHRRRRPPK